MRKPSRLPAVCSFWRGILLRILLSRIAGLADWAYGTNQGRSRAGKSPGGAAIDLREHEIGLHSQRVACHTLELARQAITDAEGLRQIYWGALLHDIGKIGIPDAILLKQGSLTKREWVEMRTHPEKGYKIISQVAGMREAADIVRCHEERFDGSGYPTD